MIDPTLIKNLRSAWSLLSDEDQAPIQAQMETAHQALLQFLETQQPPDIEGVRHELLYANAILHPLETGDILVRAFALALKQSNGDFQPPIDKYGDIWGFGQYEQLDFRWVEALLSLLLNGKYRFPFGTDVPAILSLPQDNFKVAVMGDWGTGDWGSDPGTCPAQKISNYIQGYQPDIVIHLGDVYYAGSASQESGNLLQPWPKATWGNFTLNSNHEMYPGGRYYSSEALASPIFARQAGRSYFAIETNSWIFLGLDSAYYADARQLYMNGSLWEAGAEDTPQTTLIQQVTAKGKPVILFSHHNPLGYTGEINPDAPLYGQLTSILPNPAYWYYGHIHIAAVYIDNVVNDGGRYRCLGHGALPWGKASVLQTPNVAWTETTAIPDSPDKRVANGFAILSFQGGNVTETYYTEDNHVSYTK